MAVLEGVNLTVNHFRGHDSLSLAIFNGIVLWGATDQTGTGYRVPLAFESDIRSGDERLDFADLTLDVMFLEAEVLVHFPVDVVYDPVDAGHVFLTEHLPADGTFTISFYHRRVF